MFGAICGGNLDAWMEACKLDSVIPSNAEPKIYFPVSQIFFLKKYIYIIILMNKKNFFFFFFFFIININNIFLLFNNSQMQVNGFYGWIQSMLSYLLNMGKYIYKYIFHLKEFFIIKFIINYY